MYLILMSLFIEINEFHLICNIIFRGPTRIVGCLRSVIAVKDPKLAQTGARLGLPSITHSD